MPYIDAAGVKLYCEEHGHGYPVIFLHEFGSDIQQWNTQVRYFGRAYRCVTYNARGYPPSDVPDDATSYGWQHSVDDISAVMRGLSIERAHLVGLSMGAYAALQFVGPLLVSAEKAAPPDAGIRANQQAISRGGRFTSLIPALSRSNGA